MVVDVESLLYGCETEMEELSKQMRHGHVYDQNNHHVTITAYNGHILFKNIV